MNRAAEIAKQANRQGLTLKEAAVGLGHLTPEDLTGTSDRNGW